MTVSYEEEAQKIGARLGWPLREALTLALVTGMVAEDSKATWNALDTTWHEDGATPFNTFSAGNGVDMHVWNYPDESTGLEAIVSTIDQSTAEYANLRRVGLEPASTAEDILSAFGASWCAGNMLWLNTLSRVREDQAKYFALPYPGSETPAAAPTPAGTNPQGQAAAAEHGEGITTGEPHTAQAPLSTELGRTESAVSAQVGAEDRDIAAGDKTAATGLLAKIRTHLAELEDLLTPKTKS